MSVLVVAAIIGQWGSCGVCADPPAVAAWNARIAQADATKPRKQNFTLAAAVPRPGTPSPPLLGQPVVPAFNMTPPKAAYASLPLATTSVIVPPSQPLANPAPLVSAAGAGGFLFAPPQFMQAGGSCANGQCGSGGMTARRGFFGRRGR